jgi:hypothetical protein
MRNSRCSIEHSTLHIEHYGYCRFTHKSGECAIAAETLMNNAGEALILLPRAYSAGRGPVLQQRAGGRL